MVAQLKPGMSKEQVRLILGTPLLNDIFHADRWDYVTGARTDGKREQRKLTVLFETAARAPRRRRGASGAHRHVKVAVAGAGGRMGRTLIDAVLADRELTLAAAFDVAGSTRRPVGEASRSPPDLVAHRAGATC